MAEGIRITHESGATNAVIAVKDLRTPLTPTEVGASQAQAYAKVLGVTTTSTQVWLACSICNLPHTPEEHPMGHQGFKTRHITLGPDGTAMVSRKIWQKLQTYVDDGGFSIVNTVAEPPAVRLDFNKPGGPVLTVHQKVPQEIRTGS